MNQETKRSIIAIIVVILVAVGVAFAGSQGSNRTAGIPLFALGVALAFIINWIVFIPAFGPHIEP